MQLMSIKKISILNAKSCTRCPNPPSCDHFSHHGAYNFEAGNLICKSLLKPKEVVPKW